MSQTREDLIMQGTKMGLSGSELSSWVTKQQELDRDQRLEARNAEKQQLELAWKLEKEKQELAWKLENEKREFESNEARNAEKQQLDLEKEKQELAWKIEKEKKELDLKEKELKLKEQELEFRSKNGQAQDRTFREENKESSRVKFKMPYLSDKETDPVSYLRRFELNCLQELGSEKSKWCLPLANLLQGRALSYFNELSESDVNNYDKFKELLLRRFQQNADSFMNRLRNSKPEPKEDIAAFAARISDYFDRWVDLEGITKDFVSLRDLMILEQIYASCSKELTAFLKERKPKSVKEAIQYGERFETAHPNKSISRNPLQSSEFVATAFHNPPQSNARCDKLVMQTDSSQGHGASWQPSYNQGQGHRNPSFAQPQAGTIKTDRICFQCFGRSHHATECPVKVCQRCFKSSHYTKFCNASKFETMASAMQCQGDDQSDQTIAAAHVVSNNHSDSNTHLESPCQGSHPCGCGNVDVVVSSCQTDGSDYTLYPGFVGNKRISLILDSGANALGIHNKLVSDSQLTGKTIRCVQFSGTVEELPVAEIELDTPFLKGTFHAVVGSFPAADLVIGNVNGLLIPTDDEIKLWASERSICWSPFTSKCALFGRQTAEQTVNGEASRCKISSEYALPFSPTLNVSCQELARLQRNDPKLAQSFANALSGAVKFYKSGKAFFFIDDGILYRHYEASGFSCTQIVVPSSLIDLVLYSQHKSLQHARVSTIRQAILNRGYFWPNIDRDVRAYCHSPMGLEYRPYSVSKQQNVRSFAASSYMNSCHSCSQRNYEAAGMHCCDKMNTKRDKRTAFSFSQCPGGQARIACSMIISENDKKMLEVKASKHVKTEYALSDHCNQNVNVENSGLVNLKEKGSYSCESCSPSLDEGLFLLQRDKKKSEGIVIGRTLVNTSSDILQVFCTWSIVSFIFFLPLFTLSVLFLFLTMKGRPDKIIWTIDCQKAIDGLVTALTSDPILVLPVFSKSFVLRTDAAGTGIGASLLQEWKGILYPICYISRKLLDRERRYSVIEKECLAIIWSVQKLQKYLAWSKFYIQSDHKPLSFLVRNKTTSQRLARWCLALQQFKVEVTPISGTENSLADYLSRQH